jgi:hypothetical protein
VDVDANVDVDDKHREMKVRACPDTPFQSNYLVVA